MFRVREAGRPGKRRELIRGALRTGFLCLAGMSVSAAPPPKLVGLESGPTDQRAPAPIDRVLDALVFESKANGASVTQLPLPSTLGLAPSTLSGRWTDTQFVLNLDVDKQLAKIDDGPWNTFQIKDISGKMIVFVIKDEQFIALQANDTLTITGFFDRKTRVFRRSPLA